jgi:hypothetical protein
MFSTHVSSLTETNTESYNPDVISSIQKGVGSEKYACPDGNIRAMAP